MKKEFYNKDKASSKEEEEKRKRDEANLTTQIALDIILISSI